VTPRGPSVRRRDVGPSPPPRHNLRRQSDRHHAGLRQHSQPRLLYHGRNPACMPEWPPRLGCVALAGHQRYSLFIRGGERYSARRPVTLKELCLISSTRGGKVRSNTVPGFDGLFGV